MTNTGFLVELSKLLAGRPPPLTTRYISHTCYLSLNLVLDSSACGGGHIPATTLLVPPVPFLLANCMCVALLIMANVVNMYPTLRSVLHLVDNGMATTVVGLSI